VPYGWQNWGGTLHNNFKLCLGARHLVSKAYIIETGQVSGGALRMQAYFNALSIPLQQLCLVHEKFLGTDLIGIPCIMLTNSLVEFILFPEFPSATPTRVFVDVKLERIA
jgi:hypothetical protein